MDLNSIFAGIDLIYVLGVLLGIAFLLILINENLKRNRK